MSNMWEVFDRCLTEHDTAEAVDQACALCSTCRGDLRQCEGFLVCVTCGKMHADVDMSAEWRYYGDEGNGANPNRCGLPVNPDLPESSLGCKILGVAGKSNLVMRNIQRYMNWQAMPYREKSHHEDFKHISIMAGAAGIPKMIIDDACRYHKLISEKQTFRGNNRDGIIAASIYIACRIRDCPRTAKEIAHMFHLDCASATKGCKNAMTIVNELEHDTTYSTTNTLSFIERYCSLLKMPPQLIKVAEFISMQIMKQNMIPEKTPHSIAAGIIYFISHEFMAGAISKEDIRGIIHISAMTIDKCFKTITAAKEQLVPPAVYAMFAPKHETLIKLKLPL
jgi:transcription initiation factor TFIIB